MKAKILMLGKYFPPVRGGMEEFVASLAGLVAPHHDLTVLVHSLDRRSHRSRVDGYDVVRAGTWFNLSSQPVSPGLWASSRSQTWDLVHLHVPNVLGVALTLSLPRSTKIIVTHHADMVGFGAAGTAAIKLYRRLLARTSAVTVLSLKNAALANDIRGVDVPFVAVPVPIDPTRLSLDPAIATAGARAKPAVEPGTCAIVFVGRLVPYKGIDVLLRALADVPRSQCLIAGDGPERGRLEAQCRAAGLSDRVTFLGAVTEAEKITLLHAADIFVMPSINTAEAFGIAQVEAQLCGLPVVTTDLPTGVTDVTRAGETGLVVPPGDAPALAGALNRLIADEGLRRRLGGAGRARALANYTPAAISATVLGLYADVLAGRPLTAP